MKLRRETRNRPDCLGDDGHDGFYEGNFSFNIIAGVFKAHIDVIGQTKKRGIRRRDQLLIQTKKSGEILDTVERRRFKELGRSVEIAPRHGNERPSRAQGAGAAGLNIIAAEVHCDLALVMHWHVPTGLRIVVGATTQLMRSECQWLSTTAVGMVDGANLA